MLRLRSSNLRNSLRNRKLESRISEDRFWKQFDEHLETLEEFCDELKSVKEAFFTEEEEYITFRNSLARIYDLCVESKDELTELQQKCEANLQNSRNN